MGFQSKYQSDEERQKARREHKNNYAKKEYNCEICKVTILLGNKYKHQKTKKHIRNMGKNQNELLENSIIEQSENQISEI